MVSSILEMSHGEMHLPVLELIHGALGVEVDDLNDVSHAIPVETHRRGGHHLVTLSDLQLQEAINAHHLMNYYCKYTQFVMSQP